MASTTQQRSFQFVEYGASAPPGSFTISCDGRIEGVSLELTHWNGNTTPDEYYADTSTEMALKLPTDKYQDAVILNNHYDTDGVLSVFGCLEPETAKKHADLLVSGAEAGDFDEWTSDRGLKLECILSSMLGSDEEDSFRQSLTALPEILDDLEKNDGSNYEKLWKNRLHYAEECFRALRENPKAIRLFEGRIVLIDEPTPEPVSDYAVSRFLKEQGIFGYRHLHKRRDGKLVYEKPGFGWVNRLVQRTPIPSIDKDRFVELLNAAMPGTWTTCSNKLTSICETKSALSEADLEKMAFVLLNYDESIQ